MAWGDVGGLPAPVKATIFYGSFAAMFGLYAVIVGTLYLGQTSVSAGIMESIASMAPILLKELSIPSELTPAVLGGLMAWTAPGRTPWLHMLGLLGLATAAWLMYLHLQVLFGMPIVADALLSDSTSADQLPSAVATLASFAASVRTFAAAVFAAILGLRYNDAVSALSPAGQRR